MSNITALLFIIGLFIRPNIMGDEIYRGPVNKNILIPLTKAQPEFTAEDIQEASYNDILAEAGTPLLYDIPNRTDNIILACGFINETVVKPGAEFSFNQTVGIRTEDRGFKPAPSFLKGQVEDSIGGGICQVSSTLYNACLSSNLEILSRTNHSMFSDYIEKPGLDAAVSWNAIDYRFRNNTDNPIKIFAWVENTIVYVKIMGTKTNDYTVDMECKILSTTPYQTIYKDNPGLEPGQTNIVQDPHTGYVVETYRVIRDASGNVINRTLEATSMYKKTDEIIEHNPQGSPANQPLDPSTTPPGPSNSPSAPDS